jgi:DNA-binding NarL/FixJ family response regulator
VVGEATTVREAAAAAALHPDLIVLPGVFTGVSAPSVIGPLHEQLPAARFVVLLDEPEPELLVALGDMAIAACLLLNEVTPATLQRTLAAAHVDGDDASLLWSRAAREALFAAHRARAESNAPTNTVSLTPRQQQVLALMATGLTDQAVAVQLGLTPSTVASHIHELSARVGATNRFQIGWLARELGLVSRKELLGPSAITGPSALTSESSRPNPVYPPGRSGENAMGDGGRIAHAAETEARNSNGCRPTLRAAPWYCLLPYSKPIQ